MHDVAMNVDCDDDDDDINNDNDNDDDIMKKLSVDDFNKLFQIAPKPKEKPKETQLTTETAALNSAKPHTRVSKPLASRGSHVAIKDSNLTESPRTPNDNPTEQLKRNAMTSKDHRYENYSRDRYGTQAQRAAALKLNPYIKFTEKDDGTNEAFCTICPKLLSSARAPSEHVKSGIHQNALKKLEADRNEETLTTQTLRMAMAKTAEKQQAISVAVAKLYHNEVAKHAANVVVAPATSSANENTVASPSTGNANESTTNALVANAAIRSTAEAIPENIVKKQHRRLEVLRMFLTKGIPISYFDDSSVVENLKTDGVNALPTSASTYRELIPTMLEFEKNLEAQHLQAIGNVFLSFDGTTDVADCECLNAFYWENDKQMRTVLALRFHEASMDGLKLGAWIYQELEALNIKSSSIVGIACDGHKVNFAALRRIDVILQDSLTVRCLSHLLNLIGNRMDDFLCSKFVGKLDAFFNQSSGSKLIWRSKTGIYWKGQGTGKRWWAHWELVKFVFTHREVLTDLLNAFELDDKCRANLSQLKQWWQESEKEIMLQLAAFVDFGSLIVSATYRLEADGLISHAVSSVIKLVRDHLTNFSEGRGCPLLDERIAAMQVPNEQRDAWRNKIIESFREAWTYGLKKLDPSGEYAEMFAIFNTCKLYDPRLVRDAQIDDAQLKSQLSAVPFLRKSPNLVSSMIEEFPEYRLKCLEIMDVFPKKILLKDPYDVELLQFWAQKRYQFPSWFTFFKRASLLKPSSASTERVFKALKERFSNSQASAREETREATTKLSFKAAVLSL